MIETILSTLIESATAEGMFTLLFVILLVFVLYTNHTREKGYQASIEGYQKTVEDQNKRENEYQSIVKDYQQMAIKHQEIIDDYNKKELNFQKIIQQLMNQIPAKLKKEISSVENDINEVKKDVSSLKSTIDYEILRKK